MIVLIVLLLALASDVEPMSLTSDAREVHLGNIQQLTFAGENAEAYWSADGKRLIFQSKHGDMGCDQIFTMDADGHDVRRVSNGAGRCTCSYFFPDGKRVLYASTHLASEACPPPPDYSKGYIWKLYPGYEIFTANPDGSDVRRITNHPGYDAEATISPSSVRPSYAIAHEDVPTRVGAHRRITVSWKYTGDRKFSVVCASTKSICSIVSKPRRAAT